MKKQENVAELLIPSKNTEGQYVSNHENSITDNNIKEEIANYLSYSKSNEKFEINIVESEVADDSPPFYSSIFKLH